jgi:SAM-dependent methyltransferase
VAAAEELGLVRDGGEEQLTDEFVGSVVEAVRPHRADGRGEAWRLLVASHQLIEDWLKKDGLTVVKVHDLLGRRGIVVPQRTLHRYALNVCDVGRGRRGTTVRVNDGEPGDECQIDFGKLGLVFEIGFGPGLAIAELSGRATRGTVYGIDHSEVMLQQATKRNAAAIRAKHVELVQASVEQLPPFDEPIDAILAVNSLGFWPEPTQRLVELRALLRPGGRIAIATQPRCPGATKETSTQAAREIDTLLHTAGFSQTHVETLDLDPPVVCVLASQQ